jgi:hypothetical protein
MVPPPPPSLSFPHPALGFLIPGTSANVSVYLTIIKNEGQNLFMVRQCQIALRDVNPFEENQIHSLTLSENIEVSLPVCHPSNRPIPPPPPPQWTPQETRVEKLAFQCHSNSYPSSSATDPEIPTASPGLGDSQQLPPSQSLADSAASPPQRQVAQIRYTALSSVTSYCAHIHGPPLDILRRTAEHYFHNPRNKNNAAERKTKWWLCVVELNLLFYQYLGDTKPRFSVYIADTITYVPRDSVNNSSAIIVFPDKRKWLLDFETPYETKRFVSTISESKKAMDGTSIYFKHQKQYSAKFSH